MKAQFLAVLLIGLLLAGCGSTNRPVRVTYDTADNRTTYRMSTIPVPIESPGAGYGSQFRQLQMSLRARCSGRDCKPQSVLMTLSVGGGAELFLGDRTLVITADEERFEWEDPRPDRDTRTERIVGVVAQIAIDMKPLLAIVSAERVSGGVGSVVLDIDRRTQERIRTFLVRTGHLEAPPEEA